MKNSFLYTKFEHIDVFLCNNHSNNNDIELETFIKKQISFILVLESITPKIKFFTGG